MKNTDTTPKKNVANLLFEAHVLKNIQRSGYAFLGSGKESIAEHIFTTSFIAFVMANAHPEINMQRLLSMCLVHDLPESRMGDLNYVQKRYCTAHEELVLEHLAEEYELGETIQELVEEFNAGETLEAKLARDADQLSLILELKALQDTGSRGPEKWVPSTCKRLQTQTGKDLAEQILGCEWDDWWFKSMVK